MTKPNYTLGHYNFWPTNGVSAFDTLVDKVFAQHFPDLKNDWLISFEGSAFPRVNVIENDNDITIEADIHGYKKEDVKVEYDSKNSVVTLSGSSSNEKEDKAVKYLKREIKRGSFSRSFVIGKELNADAIKAESSDGTITIKIPKVKKEDAIKRLL